VILPLESEGRVEISQVERQRPVFQTGQPEEELVSNGSRLYPDEERAALIQDTPIIP
jgi:hypothetical protein